MKNAFSINIVFLLLGIIGLVLIPRLPVQLQPQVVGQTIYVSYSWPGMGAEVVEKECTSPIEGSLAAIRGVSRIQSDSYEGRGTVRVSFKKGVDMDAARFEAAGLMRSMHSRLPDGVSLPRVSYSGSGSDDDPRLLVYTVNGEGSPYELQAYVEKIIVPQISSLSDISSVYAYGAARPEWELVYDKHVLRGFGLTEQQLNTAIRGFLSRRELGRVVVERGGDERSSSLVLSGWGTEAFDWNEVVVGRSNGRIIWLTDVAEPRLKEPLPASYYRVNGLSSIYLVVHSAKGANQVNLAQKVRSVVGELTPAFPDNFSLLVNFDASEEIALEVRKIISRALLALLVLLVFVLVVSRNFRYLLIIALSLLANLSVALIFFYFLGIEIHLYSLAGITVSLGMIIDNTIVMADHIRHHGNRRAFLAVLAATLTTMGALIVIFFLKEEQRMNLTDFAVVMVVNLAVSLAVALFLVPALLQRLPVKPAAGRFIMRRRRRVLRFTQGYGRFLLFCGRHRRAAVFMMLWAFGFPVFLLPDKLEAKRNEELKWYQQWYNHSLGHPTYVSELKPWVNRIMGGSWYWFTSYYAGGALNWDAARTRLYARGSMPDGSSIHQMNEVFRILENHLAGLEEVELFTTHIYSIDNAALEITFRPEEEHGAFPHQLKDQLIRLANQIGSADFSIYGVGQGFSNAYYEGLRNNRISFRGYNYDLLLEQAAVFKDSLLKHPRIQEVIIQTGSSWRGKPRYGFVMGLDADGLARVDASLRDVYGALLFQSPRELRVGMAPSEEGAVPVFLRERAAGSASVWDMHHSLLEASGGAYRLKDIGFLKRERTGDRIQKQNQEYLLLVEYDFIGPWELNRRVRERFVESLSASLPVGFSVHDQSGGGGWRKEEKSQYWLLLLVAAVVFVLCALLFESLLQPLAVLSAIPVAFIGLFLTFAVFEINFDQGGYAAMILLCGLTVNAALYIVNDFNNLRVKSGRSSLSLFVKAFNHKIIPILLTTLSTILGLLPFLLAGPEEGFWFSLAAGASGGLLFSLLAVLIWLPLVLLAKPLKQL